MYKYKWVCEDLGGKENGAHVLTQGGRGKMKDFTIAQMSKVWVPRGLMKSSRWLDSMDEFLLTNDTANGVVGFVLTSVILPEIAEWTFFSKYTQEYAWVEFFVGFQ